LKGHPGRKHRSLHLRPKEVERQVGDTVRHLSDRPRGVHEHVMWVRLGPESCQFGEHGGIILTDRIVRARSSETHIA